MYYTGLLLRLCLIECQVSEKRLQGRRSVARAAAHLFANVGQARTRTHDHEDNK